jgi:hypothetical protein
MTTDEWFVLFSAKAAMLCFCFLGVAGHGQKSLAV